MTIKKVFNYSEHLARLENWVYKQAVRQCDGVTNSYVNSLIDVKLGQKNFTDLYISNTPLDRCNIITNVLNRCNLAVDTKNINDMLGLISVKLDLSKVTFDAISKIVNDNFDTVHNLDNKWVFATTKDDSNTVISLVDININLYDINVKLRVDNHSTIDKTYANLEEVLTNLEYVFGVPKLPIYQYIEAVYDFVHLSLIEDNYTLAVVSMKHANSELILCNMNANGDHNIISLNGNVKTNIDTIVGNLDLYNVEKGSKINQIIDIINNSSNRGIFTDADGLKEFQKIISDMFIDVSLIQIYKDKNDFDSRVDKKINGVTQEYLDYNYMSIADVKLDNCKGCFNSNHLTNCTGCINCYNLSNHNEKGV